MRNIICAAVLAAGAALAPAQTTPANQTANPSTPPKSVTAKPRAKTVSVKTAPVKTLTPLAIPPAAVKQPDGNYRFVDAKGTAWVYRNTPFGVSRATEASVLAQKQAVAETPSSLPGGAQDPDQRATAVQKGDRIEFTRPTPFGVTRWQKDKNDLTAGEQKIWDREQAKRKP